MSLPDWEANGWLTRHQTSAQEISDLLAIANRDLMQAQTPGLDPDWRLNIAYNGALQAAVAALAATGYRAASQQALPGYSVLGPHHWSGQQPSDAI